MLRRQDKSRHVTRDDLPTSKLLWIGVGIVVGLLLVKQIPEARRYFRLERM